MIELMYTELVVINGGGIDPSILDLVNPKKIYNSAKDLAYDIKKIVNGKDQQINDFSKGFVDGVKSALKF